MLFDVHIFPNQKAPEDKKIIFSDFIAAVESGNVDEVMIQGQNIKGAYKSDKKKFVTYAPNDPELVGNLKGKGVKISAEPAVDTPGWGTIFVSMVPVLLIIDSGFFHASDATGGGERQ